MHNYSIMYVISLLDACRALLLPQAAPITGTIMLLSGVWYFGGARMVYKGPIGAQNHNPDLLKQANIQEEEARDNSTKKESSTDGIAHSVLA